MKTLTLLEATTVCREFIGRAQFQTMHAGLRGEEAQFFRDKFREYGERITNMPKTYETEGMEADEKTAWLHYFAGGQASWWIIEKDIGTPDEPGQHQAFGLADLFGDGDELGYISIVEILANGGELDLHFTPCTLALLRAKQHVAA